MAAEREIQVANRVLADFRHEYKKPRTRIHDDTAEVNMHKQRALDGICGDCVNLFIEIHGTGPSSTVALRCKKFHSPLHIYEDTPMGQVPECEDFTPLEETQPKE